MTPNHDDDKPRDAASARDEAETRRDAESQHGAATRGDAGTTHDASSMSDAEVAGAMRAGDPLANEATPAAGTFDEPPAATADPASSLTDAEAAATLREADPIAAEAAGGPAIAPLHAPAALREPAPLRVPGVLPTIDADDRIVAPPDVTVAAGQSEVRVEPIEISDVPTVVRSSQTTDAPPPATFAAAPIAEREVVAPVATNEPPVEAVAPLAVAGPVVVRTKTGPVALDVQPEPAVAPRPAPVAVRGMDAEPATIAGPVAVVAKPMRLASLDIFRGLTIALMVLVNNPGSWANLYGPLDHAKWHGWTLADLVFPFFLFIVGVATPFSLGKRRAIGGESRGTLLGHIWLRALALIVLGILLTGSNLPLPFRNEPAGFWGTKLMRLFGFGFVYLSIFALLVPWRKRAVANALPVAVALGLAAYCVGMHFVRAKALAAGWDNEKFPFGGGVFNPDMLRLPGVLQRIGLCYGVAATVALLLGRFGAWFVILATVGVYSWLMLGMPFKGHTVGSLDKFDNFARSVDVFAFERWHVNAEAKPFATQKHTYGEYPDPEGLVSTLPAIATTLIGVLAGFWLRRGDRPAAELCAGLMARGVGVAVVGVLLSWWLMPINKQLWTPSYAIFTAGLGMLTLGAVYWTADVRGRRWFFWPFKVMGVNAIAAFVASTLVWRFSRLFPFTHPRTGKATNGASWLQGEAAHGLTRASEWTAAHAAWLPTLDTAQNASLAGALAFVLVIFALMLVLYVCRIFVKV